MLIADVRVSYVHKIHVFFYVIKVYIKYKNEFNLTNV